MNLRNVLRVYSLMRQFDDDESALLNTLRSLSDPERELLVESLSPSQKKAGKKSASKSPGKSAHASSLESTIKARGNGLCVAELTSTGKPCGMARPHVIHSDHNQDVNAHNFLSAARLQEQQNPTVGGFADDTDDTRCQFTRADSRPCHLLPDHNIHHLESAAEYHEFQSLEKAAASSGD